MVPKGGASLRDVYPPGRGAFPGPKLLGGCRDVGPSPNLGPRGAPSEALGGGPGARPSKMDAEEPLLSAKRGGERDRSLGPR